MRKGKLVTRRSKPSLALAATLSLTVVACSGGPDRVAKPNVVPTSGADSTLPSSASASVDAQGTPGSLSGHAIIDLQGHTVGRISGLPRHVESLDVSPDGASVVFGSTAERGFFVIDADGADLRGVPLEGLPHSAHAMRPISPSWSPDGSRIAYLDHQGVWDGYEDIYVVDAEGGRGRSVVGESVRPPYIAAIARPRWSPDGDRILFSQLIHGTAVLRTVDITSGRITTLAGGSGVNAWGGDWSSQGAIVFERSAGHAFGMRSFHSSDIWLMNADGSGSGPLVADSQADLDPRWSPDGTRVAYRGRHGIYVVDVATGAVDRIGTGRPLDWLTNTELIVA